ncbi:MAG: pyrimidine reductase family protein [Marmoricola sp.]
MRPLTAGSPITDAMAPYLEVDRSAPPYECWVVGHMVGGLDGSARVSGRVGALSTPPDQVLFRRMRVIADVVLVGAETVRREGYGPVRLSAQEREDRVGRGQSPVPPLAVVSRSLTLDWSAPAFTEADVRTYVITCEAADPRQRGEAARHAEVIVAGADRVDPVAALTALAERGHVVVLCEGGPHWLGDLVAADRLDELCLSIAPKIGGDDLPVCVTPEGSPLRAFRLAGAMLEEDTLFLRYERG